MNSYNESLQNTVAATLQSQNLDLRSLESQNKSAMYTLYYAEGATLTAEEKLGVAITDMDNKATVKDQAVRNMGISANQLNSSTQASQYNGQAVTNMAACAANVQIAANGITRLAADVGSIFSIVNAADFGTDIYTLADQVKGLVNTTAYNAELTSQTAMEASAYTAEVSALTVLNDAKATNTLMSNILQIASGEHNTAAQAVARDNATLATVSTSEKLAEGAYKSTCVNLVTGQSAYYSVNLGLNLGFTCIPLSSDSFLVAFNRIKAAFPPPVQPAAAEAAPGSSLAPPSSTAASSSIVNDRYPVSHYYVFVVKESKQLTFSISDAENLRTNNPHRFVKIADLDVSHASEIPDAGMITQVIEYKRVPGPDGPYTLTDSDGDTIAPGSNYVIFVTAVYQDSYKRLINNFDDYITAPTLSFSMTTLLNAADNISFVAVQIADGQAKPGTDPETTKTLEKLETDNIVVDSIITKAGKENAKYILFFQAAPPADEKAKIGCNCIYLPVNTAAPERLLTQPESNLFTDVQVNVDGIRLQNEKQVIQRCIHDLEASQKVRQTKQKGADNADETPPPSNDISGGYLTLLRNKLNQLPAKEFAPPTRFFFNIDLAETLPAGSYTAATAAEDKTSVNLWYAFIGPATTDNFGNLLSENTQYATAILTLSNSDDITIIDAYTNNISDFATVTLFRF